MSQDSPTVEELQQRIEVLERQLAACQENLLVMSPTTPDDIGLAQLRIIFENYPGGIVFSRRGVIVNANPGLAHILDRPLDQIIGFPIVSFVHEDDRPRVLLQLDQFVVGSYEHRLVTSTGKIVPVEATATLVPAKSGPPLRFTVLRDITDRVTIENNLDRQRRLLEAILEEMPVGVFVAEAPSCAPILINPFARELIGKSEIRTVPVEELATEYISFIAGTDEPYPTDRLPIVRGLNGERSCIDDIEVRFEDGRRRLLQINGAPIRGRDGQVIMSVAVSQDITARVDAEASLRAEQDFLRALIKTHERDRQLMAYEIHDGLVQYLTAAVWHLESVCDKTTSDPECHDTLLRSQSLLRNAITDARRVLSGLRPPVLDEQGVLMAIDYLAAENEVPGTMEVNVVKDVQFTRLEPLLEGTLFRIVQESLNNARKHAQARQVLISLLQKKDRIHLTIEDNGRGFQTDSTPGERFGLRGIRKRAELLGGTATIESTPGKGTRISVDLPLVEPLAE